MDLYVTDDSNLNSVGFYNIGVLFHFIFFNSCRFYTLNVAEFSKRDKSECVIRMTGVTRVVFCAAFNIDTKTVRGIESGILNSFSTLKLRTFV